MAKTKKSYLVFKEVKDTGKTKVFQVLNLEDMHIGFIQWRSTWRKYVFMPASNMVMDTICLMEVVEYINSLMKERLENNPKRPESPF